MTHDREHADTYPASRPMTGQAFYAAVRAARPYHDAQRARHPSLQRETRAEYRSRLADFAAAEAAMLAMLSELSLHPGAVLDALEIGSLADRDTAARLIEQAREEIRSIAHSSTSRDA